MSRRLSTAKPASEELAAAVRWYEERRAGLGAEFYGAIVRTMERIGETPDEIRVIAIAHLRRRPGFWHHRR